MSVLLRAASLPSVGLALALSACTAPGPLGAEPPVRVPGAASPSPWVTVEVIHASSSPAVTTETAPEAPSGAELSAILFDDQVIPEFDILLSEAALRSLRQDPYVYVEGGLVYEGAVFSPVGVRLKGQNSFLPVDEKPSLKIKLDAYVPGMNLLGLEELTLNNMRSDTSMMHERVAYRMFREAGVPASRAGHALVSINGESRGLYAHVETVDENLLAQWYPDLGSMWELWDTDFREAWIPDFQHEEGVDDRTALYATADALEIADDHNQWLATAQHVDGDQFLDFTAVSAIVGQFDSYPWRSPGDDCHVYQDVASGLLQFLPHGTDETFSDPRFDFTDDDGTGLVLDSCLDDEELCEPAYLERLWEIQVLSEEVDLIGYAQRVRAQIEPYVRDDTYRPYSLDAVHQEQDDMLSFLRNRPHRLEELVGPRP